MPLPTPPANRPLSATEFYNLVTATMLDDFGDEFLKRHDVATILRYFDENIAKQFHLLRDQ